MDRVSISIVIIYIKNELMHSYPLFTSYNINLMCGD